MTLRDLDKNERKGCRLGLAATLEVGPGTALEVGPEPTLGVSPEPILEASLETVLELRVHFTLMVACRAAICGLPMSTHLGRGWPLMIPRMKRTPW